MSWMEIKFHGQKFSIRRLKMPVVTTNLQFGKIRFYRCIGDFNTCKMCWLLGLFRCAIIISIDCFDLLTCRIGIVVCGPFDFKYTLPFTVRPNFGTFNRCLCVCLDSPFKGFFFNWKGSESRSIANIANIANIETIIKVDYWEWTMQVKKNTVDFTW